MVAQPLVACVLLLACLGGCTDPLDQLRTISCASGTPYVNETWGYGFCVEPEWTLKHNEFGPLVAVGPANVNVVARYQGWTSLDEYVEGNAQQYRAMTDSEPEIYHTTLDGHPAVAFDWYEASHDGTTLRHASIFMVQSGTGITITATTQYDHLAEGINILGSVKDSWRFAY